MMATKAKTKEEATSPRIEDLNILQRIHGIMGEVGNLPKTKEIKNKAGVVMYKVVEAEKLDAALKPLLMKWRVILDSTVVKIDERQVAGDYNKVSNWTTVILEVKWRNIDDPEDLIAGQWPGLGIDNGDKSAGKALTYAFRNCRTKVLGISTGDPEPEETNGHQENQTNTFPIKNQLPFQQDRAAYTQKLGTVFSQGGPDGDVNETSGLLPVLSFFINCHPEVTDRAARFCISQFRVPGQIAS